MKITTNMVTLMHSVDVHFSACYTRLELCAMYGVARRKLVNIDRTDNLTSEQFDATKDCIKLVYKRELERIGES